MLPANRGASEWNLHVVRTAEATGLSGKDGLFKVAAATYRQRSGRPDGAGAGAGGLAGASLDADGLLGGDDRLLGAAGEMAAVLADAAGPALRWRGTEDAWDSAAAAGNGSYVNTPSRPGGEGRSGTAAAEGHSSGGARTGFWRWGRRPAAGRPEGHPRVE